MSALEELFAGEPERRRNGCRVCGQPTDALVVVQIRVRGPSGAQGRSQSESRSLCATHAIALYRQLLQALPEKRA